MIPSLKTCSLTGEQVTDKDELFLKEISAGVYTCMHEHMLNLPNNKSEEMSQLRYKSMIVVLSLSEKTEDYTGPVFIRLARDYYDEKLPPCLTEKYQGHKGEDLLTVLLFHIKPQDFFGIIDCFTGTTPRDWVSDAYDLCDTYLFATSKSVSEAIKND